MHSLRPQDKDMSLETPEPGCVPSDSTGQSWPLTSTTGSTASPQAPQGRDGPLSLSGALQAWEPAGGREGRGEGLQEKLTD